MAGTKGGTRGEAVPGGEPALPETAGTEEAPEGEARQTMGNERKTDEETGERSGEMDVTVIFPPSREATEAATREAAGGGPDLDVSLAEEAGAARAGKAGPGAAGPTANDVRNAVGPLVGTLDQVEKGVGDVVQRTAKAADHLVELRHLFVEKIKKSDTQEAAFNKLYEEMSRYRDNFLFAAQKPLFMALILLYDNIGRIREGLAGNEEGEQAVEDIKLELLEILYRHDVELIEERPERLDISFQKAVRREVTNDPGEDMRVVEVVRDGFRWNSKVFRPQEVVVKRRLAPQQG